MKPLGSGVLCTAIVGGAVIPPAMGAMAGSFGFSAALFLPMICYAYIAWYGQSSSVSAG
jgi:FHS family L-fucose permease-like MFS transporter